MATKLENISVYNLIEIENSQFEPRHNILIPSETPQTLECFYLMNFNVGTSDY